MNHMSEFTTVDAVLATHAETRGVDAFALSVIKAERQIRKLFTHLVFQAPSFGPPDVQALRKALADSRDVYFQGFIAGWDALYPRPVSGFVGPEYQLLLARLSEATRHRNKIFHGQLTNSSLSSGDLLGFVADIRSWCSTLGANAAIEIDYDGFGRNSFRKSTIVGLGARHLVKFASIADYEAFIKAHMEK
jgi:hypothetical protein